MHFACVTQIRFGGSESSEYLVQMKDGGMNTQTSPAKAGPWGRNVYLRGEETEMHMRMRRQMKLGVRDYRIGE